MGFEWDPRKGARNLQKHGVAFEDAIKVFDDPHLEWLDEREYSGEQRFIVAGAANGRVLVLVYTWREENRRIISAREATKGERELFRKEIVERGPEEK